jgi:hypothetical protein
MRAPGALIGLLLLTLSFPAAAQEPTFGELAGAAAEPVALQAVDDLDLHLLLDSLAYEARATPEEGGAYQPPGMPGLLIVPLQSPEDQDARLYLYYRMDRKEYFLLRLGTDAAGRQEMRLWSRGPAEIWISQDGAVLLPRPSDKTFRVSDSGLRLGLGGLGVIAEPLTVPETLACIARVLGISVNSTSLQTLLASTVCSASNTIGLVLTAFNCLSPTPTGILGCTLGIAKLVSCNDLSCESTPTNCRAQIAVGQRVAGTWSEACASVHQSGRFARYYTFTLTTATRLRIDLISNVDPVLFLLQGAGPSGAVLLSDDDSGLGPSSRIDQTLPAGTYTLEATTRLVRTGAFTLSLTKR